MTKICDTVLQCLSDSSHAALTVPAKPEIHDAVAVAYQTGRLDLVSVLLAIVAILLGMFALFGFGYVRGQTHAIAKTAAEKAAKRTVEQQLKPILEKMEECLDRLGTTSATERTNVPDVTTATEMTATPGGGNANNTL